MATVLFGDVVKSRRDAKGSTDWLRTLVGELESAYPPADRVADFEFTQGDEIQGLLAHVGRPARRSPAGGPPSGAPQDAMGDRRRGDRPRPRPGHAAHRPRVPARSRAPRGGGHPQGRPCHLDGRQADDLLLDEPRAAPRRAARRPDDPATRDRSAAARRGSTPVRGGRAAARQPGDDLGRGRPRSLALDRAPGACTRRTVRGGRRSGLRAPVAGTPVALEAVR